MELINDKQIQNLKPTCKEMLSWVNDTIIHKKEMYLPPKTSMKMKDGLIFYNVMPCIMERFGVSGIKVVTRYPGRHPSLDSKLSLYDLKSGYIKAIMDADFITTWRTAAVAVHSIKLFAKKDYSSIAFIGLGDIGQATLRMFIETLDDGQKVEIRIFNYKNRGSDIISQFPNDSKYTFKLFDDFENMVKDADVVVSAVTYQENDFVSPSVYKKGVLLVPVHTRGFTECDLVFDKIFCDDTDHIKGFKYFPQYKSCNETCDVVNNICVGRTSDEERIIA